MTHERSFSVQGLRSALAVACAALVTAGCSQPTTTVVYPVIDAGQIRTHRARLLEAQAAGIEPGSRGEQLAVQYLTSVFTASGLSVETQPVSLTKLRPTSTSVRIGARTLRPGDDYVAWCRRHETSVLTDADVVFVGYGISAPLDGWDDYKDVDVEGKILLMLIGSPHTGKRDLLGTMASDYYGRRRYKFEEAKRRGAAGVFLIRIDDPFDAQWELTWPAIKSASTEILGVGTPESTTSQLKVEGWITPQAVGEIFNDAGLDFHALRRLAAETNFKPVGVPLRAAVEIQNEMTVVTAANVVATLKGTMADFVLYSAQWNDLPPGGLTGSDLSDDDPSNQPPPGAPVMLEVARALSHDPTPRRTIVFLIETVASEGLLGLDDYVKHPFYPLSETRAVIHLAGFSVKGSDSQISVIGSAFSGLKDLVRERAAEQFRVASADTDLERLRFFRPGGALLTEKGIPSVFLASRRSTDYAGEVAAAPREAPGAEAPEDMSVAVLDARLLFRVGLRVATTANWPESRPPRKVVPLGTPGGGAKGPEGIR